MSLSEQLIAFIEGLEVELDGELQHDTSLIKSGLLDSLALLQVAGWIEHEIGTEADLTAFDLANEWDTIPDILNFIEKNRGGR